MDARDIGPAYAPRRTPAAYTVELDGEAVILDEARNRLHHLNPTATLVWSCFDGATDLGAIAEELAAAFASPVDAVTTEVLALTRELASEGLLDGVSPS